MSSTLMTIILLENQNSVHRVGCWFIGAAAAAIREVSVESKNFEHNAGNRVAATWF